MLLFDFFCILLQRVFMRFACARACSASGRHIWIASCFVVTLGMARSVEMIRMATQSFGIPLGMARSVDDSHGYTIIRHPVRDGSLGRTIG